MKKFKFEGFLLIILVMSIFISSCKKDTKVPVPQITTTQITSISQTTAMCGGSITSDGGSFVSIRGVCWSTHEAPTINDSTTNEGSGAGNFSSQLTGLEPSTTYYVRAYATNTSGTGYGSTIVFSTLSSNEIMDFDGNLYHTISIGSQTWTLENLKVTHYNNGDPINTTVPYNLDISSEDQPKYQWSYAGNEAFADTFGRLYTWHVISDFRKICPSGWHVPTDTEFSALTSYVGGTNSGGKLKSTGTVENGDGLWNSPNLGATNESGFTGLPGGDRHYSGNSNLMGMSGLWWSSTASDNFKAYNFGLVFDTTTVVRNQMYKILGFSVRCIKD